MPRTTIQGLPGAGSLVGYLRPTTGLVLLGAMRATGTSPPAVTLSGTLSRCANVVIDCDTGGARGTATVSWTINGVTGGTGVLTAATVDLIPASPGALVANFPTGTYNADDNWRSVISTWTGHRGNVYDGASGSESVRPFVDTLNGRPAIRTDGTARYLRTTTSALSTALVGGSDTPLTIVFAGQYNGSLTPTNYAPAIGLCDGSAGNAGFFTFGVDPSGAWRCGKRGDTGGTVNQTGGTADNDEHVFAITQSGTTVSLEVDKTSVISGAAQNVTSVTAQYVMLGLLSIPGTSPTEFYGDWTIGEVAFYTGAQSAAVIDRASQNLLNFYGL